MTRAAVGLAVLTCIVFAAPASADVRVNFVHPERYTDAVVSPDGGAGARAPVLDSLRSYLVALGSRYVRAGETLTIDVFDIDLAGDFNRVLNGLSDVRVMLPVTWPRIDVRYELRDGRTLRARGRETIRDQMYQSQPVAMSGDTLRYEKAMLDDWFRERFGRR